MSKKITGLALGAMFLALSFPAAAQQTKKVPRIGYVSGTGANNPDIEAFRQGLRDLGYIEGKNIFVEYRYAQGKLDQFPGLLAEVVQLKPDVLVVETLTGNHAAKQATKTVPIVMVTTQDPVATKIIDSLARPGGNITGVTTLTRIKRQTAGCLRVVGGSHVGFSRKTRIPGQCLNINKERV